MSGLVDLLAGRRAFGASAAFLMAALVVMAIVGRGLDPSIAVWEMASATPVSRAILECWGEAGRARAHRSLVADFAFIPAYVAFLSSVVARGVVRTSGARRRACWLALPGPLVAGLLDVHENVQLLAVLGAASPPASAVAQAALAASLKFGLLVASLATVLVALVCEPTTDRPGAGAVGSS